MHCRPPQFNCGGNYATSNCRSTRAAPAKSAATISGFVFRDLNANGACDPREPGEPGITVSAYDAGNRRVSSTITDVNGNYVLNVDLDIRQIVAGEGYCVLFSACRKG